ncbi:PKD domain-containing protein, partial [Nanoarchaeota archaeon]
KEIDYYADYFDQGERMMKLVVSDGTLAAYWEWTVDVEDVDRSKILENITDIEVYETNLVSIELPDFDAYDLEYEISEPLGMNNSWLTTYDDAGEYEVTIKIKDRGFEYSKNIDIIVNDIDREAGFDPIYNRVIREGEEVVIAVSGTDPDGDDVTFSISNAPEGSTFDGQVFRWAPDRNFVTKTGFYTSFLDKFHFLHKMQSLIFTATSNGVDVTKKVKIRVMDDNRAPNIEAIERVVVNEGETIFIEPEAYDLDGDKVKYRYGGWMNKPVKETGYEDAGEYIVYVRASDGKSIVERNLTVVVNNVNRPPTIDEIPRQDIDEGQALQFSINTNDPDYDALSTSVEYAPIDSRLENDEFSWTPSHDETPRAEAKEYTAKFIVTDDGLLNASADAIITVHNTNRAPIVWNVSPMVGEFTVYTDEQAIFQVGATDPDDDELQYTWIFGSLQRYETGPLHARTFTRPGKKTVKVIVSDGDTAVSVVWQVEVLKREEVSEQIITSDQLPKAEEKVTTEAQPIPQQAAQQEPVAQQEQQIQYIMVEGEPVIQYVMIEPEQCTQAPCPQQDPLIITEVVTQTVEVPVYEQVIVTETVEVPVYYSEQVVVTETVEVPVYEQVIVTETVEVPVYIEPQTTEYTYKTYVVTENV